MKLADVDGDGRLDAVLTRNTGTLNYFHNEGKNADAVTFVRKTLPGVSAPAYSTNWGDLDGDGDLDLVTGTYDAGLLTDRGSSYIVNSSNKGVYFYRNQEGKFSATQLAPEAQALAILLPDLNADGRPDIIVGNDFLVPDMIWLQGEDGSWTRAEPFAVTTHSTMSLDQGDVDNDGQFEIFAADMKPYSEADMVDMMPVMDDMMEGIAAERAEDRQAMENISRFQWAPANILISPPTGAWTAPAGPGRPSSVTWTTTAFWTSTRSTA